MIVAVAWLGPLLSLLGALAPSFVVLVATQSVVFLGWGREWGVRSLLTTTLFYLLVLGTEVFSLARELGMSRSTIYRKIAQYDLHVPRL